MYGHRLTHASYFSVEVNNVLSFSLNIFEEKDQCQKVEMMYSKCDNYFISHLLSFSSVMSSCAKVTPELEKCSPSLKHLIPTLQHCRISFCTRTSWFCSTLYPVAPISVSLMWTEDVAELKANCVSQWVLHSSVLSLSQSNIGSDESVHLGTALFY